RRHRIDFSAVTEHSCFDDPGPHETATYATMQATARAEGMEMLLLPGEEFTTHALHLVLLGVRRTYPAGPYRLPTPKEDPPHHGYDYRRLIAEVHREGGYVIVAHWWSHRQWRRVDWRLLVEYGVDGFEVTNGPELAPRELIEEWRKTGLPLFAASDFHGWQKSMYSWNLVEGGTAAERDPYEFLHRLFRERRVRPVVALYYDPRVPAFLEPPVGVWRYFTGLPPPNRIPWIVITVAAWAWLALRARRA
ncbi:MAG: hypothetical protein HYY17_11460, partial [Planctomycetes bacterium]|nr:hypothetical protein [Planctomycetota bacterium]